MAEELHFGRAALALGLSQPQVSRHVAELERTLGVALFVRTPRHTELTGAGQSCSPTPGRRWPPLSGSSAGPGWSLAGAWAPCRSGFIWSTLNGYLAPLVAAAGERHPEIELTVNQLRFREILTALRRGDVDLMITRAPALESELVELTLNREPSVLAIPEDHPLAAETIVGVEQLHGQPLVTLSPDVIPGAYEAGRRRARRGGHRARRAPAGQLALRGSGARLPPDWGSTTGWRPAR